MPFVRRPKLRKRLPGRQATDVYDTDDGDAIPARRTGRRRGIYILPNLFTTAALFCGFYAIVQAMNDRFDHAAIAIFAAMVLDSLDGRVARMTNTQSEFGAEYDSLSDMVSFGAAPALVVDEVALRGLGKLGWIAAFIYVAGAALRLARFNTNIAVVDKNYFQGLPSPSAAALVAGLVWVMQDLGVEGLDYDWLACIVTIFAGLTMVSNVQYYSGKTLDMRKSVPFITIFLIALVLAGIAYDPPRVLFGIFCVYGVSGYVVYLWRLQQGKPVSIISTDPEPEVGIGAKQLDEDAAGR
ncbi:CDP-diacylglycerol--serine O-phosphatidyltransferase [soil metagenome]